MAGQRMLVVVLVLAACGEAAEPAFEAHRPSSAASPPAENDLAARFAARIRAADPSVAVEVGADGRVEVDGAEVDLRNMRVECERAPAHCDAVIDRWVRGRLDDEPEVDGAHVRAVLVHEELLGELGGALRRPFVGPLWEVFVLDRPDTLVFMSPALGDELGITDPTALHELALENMRAAFGSALPHEAVDPRTPGVQAVETRDSYENARVLLPELWAPVAAEVEGDLLVAAPARDVVLFTGAASADDVRLLRYLAQVLSTNEPHPIGPTIVRLRDGAFELYDENVAPLVP